MSHLFERAELQFTKGKVVIHPHHGPSTVKRIAKRTVRGERATYVTLLTEHGDLSVSIPSERAAEFGVRDVMGIEGVREIFEVLMEESGSYQRIWSRRFKDYTERLNSGDVHTIAGLIRDLTRRNEERRISYGEMGILREATALLSAELALSLDVSPEQVSELMNEAALNDVAPELTKDGLDLAS